YRAIASYLDRSIYERSETTHDEAARSKCRFLNEGDRSMARVGCSTPFSHRAARHCACGIVAALLSTATPTLSAKTPLPAASAQTRPAAAAAQAMGNADVSRRAAARLPESVIVTAIEAAESAQFDVSANGLVALKTA